MTTTRQQTRQQAATEADLIRAISEQITDHGNVLYRLYDIVAANLRAEKVERVEGVVMGRRADGQVAAWLYGPEHLQYKVATVWVEDIDRLPVSLDGLDQFPTASPPLRAEAVGSPYWRPADFAVVLKATGQTTDTGRARYDFDRVYSDDDAGDAPPAGDRVDRAAVARAADDDAAARLIASGYDDAIGDADRVRAFVGYVTDGARPVSYAAALIAAEAYAVALAAGSNGRGAGSVARAVYAAAAGSLQGAE